MHIKVTRPNLKKLDDRSKKGIFVGYDTGSKAYRCYDPIDQRIIITRNVVFNEARQWSWENTDNELAADAEPFTVEYETEVIHDAAPASPSPTPPLASPPTGEYAAPGEEEHEVKAENLDADHDDAPLRVRAIDDMIGNVAMPALARRVLEAQLNFTSAEEPTTFREVEQDAAWHAAT
jgi:hypothetical protein